MNTLYYGDNLEVLRKYLRDETVDLAYIDPPFNSRRNYNQIYNNVGSEDRAQAFVDTWVWDEQARHRSEQEIVRRRAKLPAKRAELVSSEETKNAGLSLSRNGSLSGIGK